MIRCSLLEGGVSYVVSCHPFRLEIQDPFKKERSLREVTTLEKTHDTFETFGLRYREALLAPYDCLPFAPRFGRFQRP